MFFGRLYDFFANCMPGKMRAKDKNKTQVQNKILNTTVVFFALNKLVHLFCCCGCCIIN